MWDPRNKNSKLMWDKKDEKEKRREGGRGKKEMKKSGAKKILNKLVMSLAPWNLRW